MNLTPLGQVPSMAGHNFISDIELDEKSVIRWSPQVEHERKVAIFDLLEENSFSLVMVLRVLIN